MQLEVCDFNPDASTLAIRQSKSGPGRPGPLSWLARKAVAMINSRSISLH